MAKSKISQGSKKTKAESLATVKSTISYNKKGDRVQGLDKTTRLGVMQKKAKDFYMAAFSHISQSVTSIVGRKSTHANLKKLCKDLFKIKLTQQTLGTEFPNLDIAPLSKDRSHNFKTTKPSYVVIYSNVNSDKDWKTSVDFTMKLHTFLRKQEDKLIGKFALFESIIPMNDVILAHFVADPDLPCLKELIFGKLQKPPVYSPSEIIFQVMEGANYLNTMGVAHRYIRANTVLVSAATMSARIPVVKLSTLDAACMYWNVETDAPILQKKGLGLVNYEVDHLPPECFTEGYDATNVDIWSIGVLLCLLVAQSSPFNIKTPKKLVDNWRNWSERPAIPDRYRKILDDIFKPTEMRTQVWRYGRKHVKKTTSAIVDSKKAKPDSSSSKNSFTSKSSCTSNTPLKSKSKSSTPFRTKSSTDMFESKVSVISLTEKIRSELQIDKIDTIYKHNKLRVVDSLAKENFQYAEKQFYDPYMCKGIHPVVCTWKGTSVEIKTFMLAHLPEKFKMFLLKENHKILTFLSEQQDVPKSFHKLLDVIHSKIDSKVVYVYESLGIRKSLYFIATEKEQALEDVKWILQQLMQLLAYFSKCGVAHRYLRPENVYLVENQRIKLTYSELMCMAVNPEKGIKTLRTRGLQDRQLQIHNHLPPECFDSLRYDPAKVDIWSFGVLSIFLLNGGKMVFKPHRGIAVCKSVFANTPNLTPDILKMMPFLERIFTPPEERLSPQEWLELTTILKMVFKKPKN